MFIFFIFSRWQRRHMQRLLSEWEGRFWLSYYPSIKKRFKVFPDCFVVIWMNRLQSLFYRRFFFKLDLKLNFSGTAKVEIVACKNITVDPTSIPRAEVNHQNQRSTGPWVMNMSLQTGYNNPQSLHSTRFEFQKLGLQCVVQQGWSCQEAWCHDQFCFWSKQDACKDFDVVLW